MLLTPVTRPGTAHGSGARVLYPGQPARAWLTAAAAAPTSLRQRHAVERQLTDANRPVEREVKMIRAQLGLPPPSAS